MSEQEKKRQIIYDFLNAETEPEFLCLPYSKQRNFFFLQKKSFLRKKAVEDWTKKKWKEGFSTALATAIKNDPTTSIRKRVNELKVHEKNVRTAIKQDLSPDLNPLDYAT